MLHAMWVTRSFLLMLTCCVARLQLLLHLGRKSSLLQAGCGPLCCPAVEGAVSRLWEHWPVSSWWGVHATPCVCMHRCHGMCWASGWGC